MEQQPSASSTYWHPPPPDATPKQGLVVVMDVLGFRDRWRTRGAVPTLQTWYGAVHHMLFDLQNDILYRGAIAAATRPAAGT